MAIQKINQFDILCFFFTLRYMSATITFTFPSVEWDKIGNFRLIHQKFRVGVKQCDNYLPIKLRRNKICYSRVIRKNVIESRYLKCIVQSFLNGAIDSTIRKVNSMNQIVWNTHKSAANNTLTIHLEIILRDLTFKTRKAQYRNA